MSRIRKTKPKPHVVLVDTSVLWHEDKSHPANPAFDELWVNTKGSLDANLVVPEVVYQEILFQQTTSAVKLLGKATEAFHGISSIARRPFGHRVTAARIKLQIRNKLDKWVADKKAYVRPVPCATIDWPRFVERALWREPPFTFDPKDRTEKGFRDALILETLVEYCRAERGDVVIVFICGDNLLRTAAEKALKDDRRCLFYESADDFASYVKLTKERLTQRFIKLILPRATRKFYRQADQTCLYVKEGLRDKLNAERTHYLEDPEIANPTTVDTTGSWGRRGRLRTSARWDEVGQGKYWIGAAQFSRLDEASTYHWISIVTYVRLYRSHTDAELTELIPGFQPELRVLMLPFYVTWRARVTGDGRFHDVGLAGIELKGSSFLTPTEEQVERYGLGGSEA